MSIRIVTKLLEMKHINKSGHVCIELWSILISPQTMYLIIKVLFYTSSVLFSFSRYTYSVSNSIITNIAHFTCSIPWIVDDCRITQIAPGVLFAHAYSSIKFLCWFSLTALIAYFLSAVVFPYSKGTHTLFHYM